MKQKILPWIIALAALSISVSAAFYSVTGLSKLFAGASMEVIIMASSLEFAKLVIASLLYQYWSKLNKLLKVYLSIACVVLILITSAGIYGFLSSAYQQTATLEGNISAQIELLERKKANYQEQLAVYIEEKTNITSAITSLREGLSNNVIQYTNADGQVITTTSSATRKSLEKQLDQAIERQTEINDKVDNLNQQIFDLDTEIVEVQTSSETASELGPLKYISGLMGVEMDKVVNYLLLVIVFVFDPLAISLVLAANFAFEQNKPKVHEVKITPTIKK
jgi:regulator of replication initiation timing